MACAVGRGNEIGVLWGMGGCEEGLADYECLWTVWGIVELKFGGEFEV